MASSRGPTIQCAKIVTHSSLVSVTESLVKFERHILLMARGFSKENQSSIDTAYRFGDFELHPRERLLKRGGEPVPLQPKIFDALLCLVGKAEHLVSKQELTDALWPSIHVSESNLTNTIVSLRKIVGHGAIRTVSKHGYRFLLPVAGEPAQKHHSEVGIAKPRARREGHIGIGIMATSCDHCVGSKGCQS